MSFVNNKTIQLIGDRSVHPLRDRLLESGIGNLFELCFCIWARGSWAIFFSFSFDDAPLYKIVLVYRRFATLLHPTFNTGFGSGFEEFYILLRWVMLLFVAVG